MRGKTCQDHWRYSRRSKREKRNANHDHWMDIGIVKRKGRRKKGKLVNYGNEILTRGRLLRDSENISTKCPSIQDYTARVYQVQWSHNCFPLLDYHCSLANDIVTKYQSMKLRHYGLQNVPLPPILQKKELLFTVVTNGEISEDLPLIFRKQNLDNIKYTDVTENSFIMPNTIQAVRGSSCCIVFEHENINLDIQADKILRVSPQSPNKTQRQKDKRAMKSDMTEQDIRRNLTHFLSEPLFSYAEAVAGILEKLANATSALPDPKRLVEQAMQAVHGLLNRQDRSRSLRSSETGKIPDKVATKLHMLAMDGVFAFGLFSTGMIVFVDNKTLGKQRRRNMTEKVREACAPVYNSPRVEFISKSSLKPTSITQGGKLKNKSKQMRGTLGMVTRAKVKRMQDQKKDRKGSKGDQSIVVGLTSGHYFNEGDSAVGYEDAENKTETDLGKCIASSKVPDVAVIQISESDKHSFDFRDQNGKLSNCVPIKQEMKLNDVVYKRGDETGLTKGFIRSHLFRVCTSEEPVPLGKLEEGYFVTGDGNRAFAAGGDSGSIVFFPDLEDMERETVQIMSIQSSVFKQEAVDKLGLPPNTCYTVRADRCFEKLQEKGIEMTLPTRADMG